MGFKPFKWIKNHPWETAALAATAAIGGPMLFSALGAEGAAGAAGAAALETGGPAMLGADAMTGASLGSAAAGAAPFAPEILQGYGMGAMGEGVTAQMAMSPYALPSGGSVFGASDPMLLGGNTPVGSPYSGMWDKAASVAKDKFSDPKSAMRAGMMLAQMGGRPPAQMGGPAGGFEPPAMRSAMHSQEEITKKWLMQNDPNTYRRIYGDPQGVA